MEVLQVSNKTIKTSSPLLYNFYCSWIKWAQEGGDEFLTHWGLCNAVVSYCNGSHRGFDEMQEQFSAAGLNDEYPFGEWEYDYALELDTMHLDENRLKWVEDRIRDYKENTRG